jgi:hypothetical protein
MGGGGEGQQTTQNTGTYPEEFKPIARNAAKNILAMQSALPLVGFSQPNPGQTAGLAPFQQAVANFAPSLLAPSWGLQTLQNLGGPISQLAGNAINAGNQTDPYTRAMNAAASGGFGAGAQSFPGAPFQNPTALVAPSFNQTAPQPTVVGPGTENLISQLTGSLSSPIPATTPTLSGAVTGPLPYTGPEAQAPPPMTPQLDALIQQLITQTAPLTSRQQVSSYAPYNPGVPSIR